MKNLKALFLLLIGAIAMSLTSCNTDDGYSAYTPEQQKRNNQQSEEYSSKGYGIFVSLLYFYRFVSFFISLYCDYIKYII